MGKEGRKACLEGTLVRFDADAEKGCESYVTKGGQHRGH